MRVCCGRLEEKGGEGVLVVAQGQHAKSEEGGRGEGKSFLQQLRESVNDRYHLSFPHNPQSHNLRWHGCPNHSQRSVFQRVYSFTKKRRMVDRRVCLLAFSAETDHHFLLWRGERFPTSESRIVTLSSTHTLSLFSRPLPLRTSEPHPRVLDTNPSPLSPVGTPTATLRIA